MNLLVSLLMEFLSNILFYQHLNPIREASLHIIANQQTKKSIYLVMDCRVINLILQIKIPLNSTAIVRLPIAHITTEGKETTLANLTMPESIMKQIMKFKLARD